MINLATWNIRGFNSPIKHKKEYQFVRTYKICFVGILETKFKEENNKKINKSIFGDWNFDHNEDVCFGDRIWLGWTMSS